jgi:hypothetical protein
MNAIQKVLNRRQKPESVSIEVKDLKVSAGGGGTRKEHFSFSLTQWGVSSQNTIYNLVTFG